MTKYGILSLAVLFTSSAWACIELPKKIELDGATFSSGMDLSINTNCGLSINLDTRADGMNYPAVMPSSEFPNPVSELHMEYGDDGKLCFKGPKGCSPAKVASIHRGPAVIGTAEISKSGDVFLFSTDSHGKKNLNLPYIKLTGSSKDGAIFNGSLEAYDKGSAVGDFHLKDGICTREIEFQDASSTAKKTKLRGNSISLTGSGCTAQLATKPYHVTKTQLKIDGQVMPVSGDATR